jgi:hypothetical protein
LVSRRSLALVGALAALSLAGCGGDDDFDGRARSICADWREKVEANPLPKVRGVRDRPVAGAYFARQARIWRDAQFAGDGPRITALARQLQADRDRLLRSAEAAGQRGCLE